MLTQFVRSLAACCFCVGIAAAPAGAVPPAGPLVPVPATAPPSLSTLNTNVAVVCPLTQVGGIQPPRPGFTPPASENLSTNLAPSFPAVGLQVDSPQKTVLLGDPSFRAMTKQNPTFAGSTVSWQTQTYPTPQEAADFTFNLVTLQVFMRTGPPFYFANYQGQCTRVTKN
jgi:hypothetical protein